MPFIDDTKVVLLSTVWLVNSAEDADSLRTLEDEELFLSKFTFTGRIDRDANELRALRALRPQLRTMVLASRDDMVTLVNDALAEAGAAPRLVRHTGSDWHIHAVEPDRPLAERILVETAMALIDVIRRDEISRISVCADTTCNGVALDLSRNRSKIYCSVACANRNAVAAYRARQADA